MPWSLFYHVSWTFYGRWVTRNISDITVNIVNYSMWFYQKYAGMSWFSYQLQISLLKTSAHPTSGGPYFWAAMLSRKRNAPFASWITGKCGHTHSSPCSLTPSLGWFNLLGQVAVTTGIRSVYSGWSISCQWILPPRLVVLLVQTSSQLLLPLEHHLRRRQKQLSVCNSWLIIPF